MRMFSSVGPTAAKNNPNNSSPISRNFELIISKVKMKVPRTIRMIFFEVKFIVGNTHA